MSAGGVNPEDFLMSSASKPWIEDLIRYALRYNVDVGDVRKGFEVIRKAVSVGDFDTAVNVLCIMMANAQSPPWYISPYPCDAKVTGLYVLEPDEVRRAGLSFRNNADTYAVLIGYCYVENGKFTRCNVIGWKMHWLNKMSMFFTEPMPPHEIGLSSKFIEVKERGGTVGEGGVGHPEGNAYGEAEEGGHGEPEEEELEGADLDEY